MTGLPGGVVGFEAIGTVSAEDHRSVLTPGVEAAIGERITVREFPGVTVAARGYSFGNSLRG